MILLFIIDMFQIEFGTRILSGASFSAKAPMVKFSGTSTYHVLNGPQQTGLFLRYLSKPRLFILKGLCWRLSFSGSLDPDDFARSGQKNHLDSTSVKKLIIDTKFCPVPVVINRPLCSQFKQKNGFFSSQ
jgi:hypothetical protein